MTRAVCFADQDFGEARNALKTSLALSHSCSCGTALLGSPAPTLWACKCVFTATATVAHSSCSRCCETGHKPCFLSPPKAITSQLPCCVEKVLEVQDPPFVHPCPKHAQCLLQPPNRPQSALKNAFHKATSKRRRVVGCRFNTIFPIKHL